MLNHTWELKRGLSQGISTGSIDEMYKRAMDAGASGGKLLGAGGGGFLLFYVEPDRQVKVMKAMEELLYIPFKFENNGSGIVHYSPEEYKTDKR